MYSVGGRRKLVQVVQLLLLVSDRVQFRARFKPGCVRVLVQLVS